MTADQGQQDPEGDESAEQDQDAPNEVGKEGESFNS